MKIENVVVISLEDYAEYQELKNKKNKVDFDRLKTGSVVKIKYTPQFCSCGNVDFEKHFDIVLYRSEHLIDGLGNFGKYTFKTDEERDYITFHQDGKYCLFLSSVVIDYITEVIAY